MIPQSVRIPGWPYYLTIEGHVYRDGAKKPLKPVLSREGYCVTLCKNGKTKTFRLNNLMRDLYFGGVKLPMLHLDGCATNFAYWNLKPTPREKLASVCRPYSYRARAVVETLPDGTEIVYPSVSECARAIFVNKATVRNWCNGKTENTINGNRYRWEELENGRLSKG